MKLYTIGHSTHELHEFLDLLKKYNIKHVVDIRTIPKSRYVPWFNKTNLAIALEQEEIFYTNLVSLGGLRKSVKNSINTGWRNTNFRGFADYMLTSEFYSGLKQLNQLIKRHKNVVIMCAEALPWRCHRSLIADAEIIRGVKVMDIMSRTSVKTHRLTSFAKIDRSKRPIKIYYPA